MFKLDLDISLDHSFSYKNPSFSPFHTHNFYIMLTPLLYQNYPRNGRIPLPTFRVHHCGYVPSYSWLDIERS